MKTTLNLPDSLMRRVKIRAASEGRKLTDLIAELLEAGLAQGSVPALAEGDAPFEIDPETGFPVARSVELPGFTPPSGGEIRSLIEHAMEE